MINIESVDYESIKNDITEYIKNNIDDIDPIISSNIGLITSLLAGYTTYNQYKYLQYRNETYLDTATQPSSIYNIARTFGYNINRFTAPVLSFTYIGNDTIFLKPGDVIGTYEDYELVYFDNPKAFEDGDTVNLMLGKVKIVELQPQDELNYTLFPDILTSIHNKVFLQYDNIIEVSRNIEDYLVYEKPIDFSLDIFSTIIEIQDKDYYYGMSINKPVKIISLETNGKITQSNFLIQIENFVFKEVSHYGSNGDTLDFIKKISPYYFSTLRRMVTKNDHIYILKANNLLKDVYVERDDGIGAQYKLELLESGDFFINVNGFNISGTVETIDDLYNILKKYNNKFKVLYNDNLFIQAINGRDEFNVIVSDNISKEKTIERIEPLCCTINCYYIKYNTVDDPILLTEYEEEELSKYVENYKMVGTKLMFSPALKIEKELNINIKLKDNKYKDIVLYEINKILDDYELNLTNNFYYGNFIVQVSNITIFDKDLSEYIRPVEYIVPNQEVFDVELNKYYIKWIRKINI